MPTDDTATSPSTTATKRNTGDTAAPTKAPIVCATETEARCPVTHSTRTDANKKATNDALTERITVKGRASSPAPTTTPTVKRHAQDYQA